MDRSFIDRERLLPTLATALAFAVAVALALPQPPDPVPLAIGAVVGCALSWIGFRAAARSRPPIPSHPPAQRLKLGGLAVACGAALGLALLGLLAALARLEPALRARFVGRRDEPGWRPWVLAVESSILEEVAFRLFLLSVVAWLVVLISRGRPPGPRPFAVGLLVSTVAFGLVHLPAWAAAAPVGWPLVAAVLALNGIGGLLLGWIFWRWGLAYAICCHFAGDVVIQALGPRLLS